MWKKSLSLLIVGGLLLGLAACGEEQSTDDTIVYVPEFVSFESDLPSKRGFCVAGDGAYIWQTAGDGVSLVRASETGGDPEPLPDYQQITPPDIANTSQVSFQWYYGSLQAAPDGTIWEAVPVQIGTQADGAFSTETFYVLRHLDQNGKELSRVDLTGRDITGKDIRSIRDAEAELGYFSGFSVDQGGNIYAMFAENIAVLDQEGTLLFILPVPEGTNIREINSLVVLSDGRVGAKIQRGHTLDETETCLRVLNADAGKWDDPIPLAPGSNVAAYSGDANTPFYYRAASALYAWREETSQGEYLLNLMDSDIDSGTLSSVSALSDGRLLLAGNDSSTNVIQLAYLTPTPAYELGQTVLTLATFGASPQLQKAIREFNQSNGKYRISVSDYTQYGDGEAAMTRMATEIGAGQMPDILDMSLMGGLRSALQKYLEDLWPYIDSDPELGRDKLMVRALESEEVDGKLLSVGSAFSMYSHTGRTDVVGDRTSWTLEDMQAALETLPDGGIPFFGGKARMLQALMRLGGSRFIDTEAGTCSFDSGEFLDVLTFCAGLPERPPASGQAWTDAYRDGEVLLYPMGFSDFYFPQYARYIFGAEVSFVGIPNNWGLTGSSIGMSESLAMSNVCEHKDGAWAFLRTALLPRVPEGERASSYYYGFPINKADFDLMAQQAMTPEYEMKSDGSYVLNSKGEKVEKEVFTGYHDAGTSGLRCYAVSQADYDQIMALYNTIECPEAIDADVIAIITSAAAPYFAGAATLDDTATTIQNKASLYVNEQK